MSFPIEHGLFKLYFTDQYAILGVSLDADSNEIRKRYLTIARHLHPDACRTKSEAEKHLANQFLSKVVNPAYEKIHPDKARAEYHVTLGRVRKRLISEASKVQVHSETAKQLAQAGNDFEQVYKTLLQKLATGEYTSLEKNKILETIAEISELNMIYLIRKEVTGQKKPLESSIADKTEQGKTKIPEPEKPPVMNPTAQQTEQYCRRAEEYITKGNFDKAILELRDALQLEPSSSHAHGLIGWAYLQKNQPTMAKIHINKALQLNPNEAKALEGKQELEKQAKKAASATAKSTTPTKQNPGKPNQGKPDDKSGGTTIFGIKFGGKK